MFHIDDHLIRNHLCLEPSEPILFYFYTSAEVTVSLYRNANGLSSNFAFHLFSKKNLRNILSNFQCLFAVVEMNPEEHL